MATSHVSEVPSCSKCVDRDPLGIELSMAFQPIINVATGIVYAHEALVRGPNGEGADTIFAQVNAGNLYRFDQACRVKAVELAAKLKMPCRLSINFMPNAVYRPELCIRTTLLAANRYGFPVDRIIFEIAETENVDRAHLKNIVSHYKSQGFLIALDDFGAGYAGLNMLADIEPDLIKLDMHLIRDIDKDERRLVIVRAMVQMCRGLGIEVIAEGIETVAEQKTLEALGIVLQQGFLFAKAQFEALAA